MKKTSARSRSTPTCHVPSSTTYPSLHTQVATSVVPSASRSVDVNEGSASYDASSFVLNRETKVSSHSGNPRRRASTVTKSYALRKPGYDALVLFVMETNATDDSSRVKTDSSVTD